MGLAIEFCILGSLEFCREGKTYGLRAPRQAALLATLVFEANRVVPADRLIDAIWGDEPPTTAKGQLQICVSKLRKVLGGPEADEIIVTQGPGYQLRVPEERIDAVRFEQLVMRGRSAAEEGQLANSVKDMRAALAYWRGPAAAGVESRIVQIAATRLNEQRATVVEECIGIELELGRQNKVIGELAALVEEHPLREKLREHQMLALYRAKRPAEALEAFRRARETFIEELGLEPGDELQQLEQAILANDPRLDLGSSGRPPLTDHHAAAIIPRQLPTDIADFTGRQEASDEVSALLRQPDRECGRSVWPMPVVVLTGMSGVGKTALAVRIGHLLKEDFRDGQLFVQLRGNDTLPVSPRQALERCLRALGVEPIRLPTDTGELAETYRSALALQRVLVVLDDAASIAQIIPMLPGNEGCGVIVTSRHRLSELPGARLFEVGVLPADSACELLGHLLGNAKMQVPYAQLMAIAELCGYLPLALRIVAAKMIERPHWNAEQIIGRLQDEEGRLAELQIGDVGVAASISLSYQSLTADARRLFVRLSLLGDNDFGFWVSAPLLDVDLKQAEDLLGQLVASNLLEVQRGEKGSVRFHLHDLVRMFAVEHFAEEQAPNDRRATLARLLGCWLFMTAEAHRRVYGGDFTLLHGTSTLWALNANAADGLLADPLDWLRSEHRALVSAIRKAAQAGFHEGCWDLAVTAVTLFEADSLFDDWRQSAEMALKATRRAHNMRGEAAILCSLGELALVEHRIDEARSSLEQARDMFEAIGELHGRGLAMSHLAFSYRLQGHQTNALALYKRAVSDLREARDQIACAHALSGMAQLYVELGEDKTADRLLNEALALCSGKGVRRVEAQVTHRIAEFYLVQGRFDRANQSFKSVLDAARTSRDLLGEAHALHGLGVTLTQMARYDAAAANLSAALAISRKIGDRLLEGRILFAVSGLSTSRGNSSSALTALAKALDVFQQARAVVWQARALAACAKLHAAAGRDSDASQAREQARELVTDTDAGSAPDLMRHLSHPKNFLDARFG